ncbi:putative ABC transporter ATP-binding protein [Gordonia effusa NBRC 100432]|uniref:Putative ABC transporter ATP-binding protein n=1 Tax=Gordonia effusa NBRC 100432 TaxID=1077974 RepID=H0QXL8_9ACTN|nr:ABC transporter ATP-binding protein [Gordonia effusa]GAB17569.1 putative ABC transporter ATP-binding protein [Gordonia effusa NBRC 100432]
MSAQYDSPPTVFSPYLLTVRNLSVRIPGPRGDQTVVRGLDLDIAPGECVALVGESGSGKTVTARALSGQLPADWLITADEFSYLGEDLRKSTTKRWRELRGGEIALMVQNALISLNPLHRIGAEVAEALRIHRTVPSRERPSRVLELLTDVGIPDPEVRARQYPHELSGGLRQRALIASVVAADPKILLADEPTTALDATVRRQIVDLLLALKSTGMGQLLITHDLSMAAMIADRVAVMYRGELVEFGPAAQVLSSPAHEYTAMLAAAVPSVTEPRRRLGPAHPAGISPRSATRDTELVLRAADIVKEFQLSRTKRVGVGGVSFELRAGRTLGVLGESGSGKTTLARIVLGLTKPDSGNIFIGDQNWTDASERERRPMRTEIQGVHQDPVSSFDPRATVRDVLLEAIRAESGDDEPRERMNELLDLVGLSPSIGERHPRTLSGGQCQRIAIARALARRPRILVCDEPTSALDVSVQARVLDLLKDLQDELGMAMLFISHDLGVIRHVSDRVLVMKDGAVVEEGAVDPVFTSPTHSYTRELLGSVYTGALEPTYA